MKFNAADLDQDHYIRRAKEEASQIYSKDSTRRSRQYVDILQTTLYGHAPEVYLIDKCGFTDDTRPYKDVIDTNGNPVEVKVTEGDYYVPYVLDRVAKAKSEEWRGFPDILYVFIGDKVTADYSLYGIYEWSENKFVLQESPTMV